MNRDDSRKLPRATKGPSIEAVLLHSLGVIPEPTEEALEALRREDEQAERDARGLP